MVWDTSRPAGLRCQAARRGGSPAEPPRVARRGAGRATVGLKVALAGSLTRLHRAAVDGAVPESVCAEQVRALWLGDIERERLR